MHSMIDNRFRSEVNREKDDVIDNGNFGLRMENVPRMNPQNEDADAI